VFSPERPTGGALAAPFTVLKKKNDRNCADLELAPLRGEKNSSHAHKTGSWYLLGVLFKICDEHPHPFYMGLPPHRGMDPKVKCWHTLWPKSSVIFELTLKRLLPFLAKYHDF